MPSQESIKDLLDSENSKKMALKVRDEIIADSSRMGELMDCFFDEDLRTCQRAAWPLSLIAEKSPNLLYPFLDQIITNLDTPHHDAVIRNTFRAFQFMDFPEDMEGLIFEKAFNYLLDLNQAVAIRVFSMSVCGNIALKYPELCHELIPVIEDNLPHGSAGFKARGKKILKSLRPLVG